MRRKIWQRVLAVALLAGSAAFSYVAWSRGPLPVRSSHAAVTAPQAATGSQAVIGESPTPMDEQLQALRQDQVTLLRQENQLLRQRVITLRESLDATRR